MPTKTKPHILRSDVFIPNEKQGLDGWRNFETSGLPYYALVNDPSASVFQDGRKEPLCQVRDLIQREPK